GEGALVLQDAGENPLPPPPAAAALALVIVTFLIAAGWPAAAVAGGQKVDEGQAIAAADKDPKVRDEKGEHPGLGASAAMKEGHWEVGYFVSGDELAVALVDTRSGEVTESWTGYQVAWKMARGYSGAFGHKLNAPYVFLPLCLIFLIGLVDWRRLRRVANLDLLVLLGFGVSHYFFNRGDVGVSVPLAYPALLYLLGRCLWIGWRGRGKGLRPVWSVTWLIVAALFLMGFRVGLNVADAGAIDVGYAGVVGADRIAHGEPVYDNFPADVSRGDTYGPVNYLAYAPFERIWPWSGSWDDLPAAHAASILFDLATFAFLILLGIRIRPGPAGQRLAAILAFGWAAYPYTAYALESNTNDSLIAALLLATLLLAARPIARGAGLALATWAKFAPAVLIPMYMTWRPAGPVTAGDPPPPPVAKASSGEVPPTVPPAGQRRQWIWFGLGFVAVTLVVMTWPAIDPGLKTFYDRTIASQAGRDSPFSLWGQTSSLEPIRIGLLALTGALSLAFAVVPRRKSLLQVAALSAALLILLQLTLQHWFYLYIVWFYPLLLVALAALEPSEDPAPTGLEVGREPSPARRSQPAPAG
ncbi:MAG TPA: hypothetical protein VNB59_00515, partial [Solirubrobacterales bacterium]|nr:hypothetical protein [Solirubrobacterales bacterium]